MTSKAPAQPQKSQEELQQEAELKRMRDEEKRRAEEDKTRATQDQLRLETQARGQTGIRALSGASPGLGVLGRRMLTSMLGSG